MPLLTVGTGVSTGTFAALYTTSCFGMSVLTASSLLGQTPGAPGTLTLPLLLTGITFDRL